jgi:hypothetical protein
MNIGWNMDEIWMNDWGRIEEGLMDLDKLIMDHWIINIGLRVDEWWINDGWKLNQWLMNDGSVMDEWWINDGWMTE